MGIPAPNPFLTAMPYDPAESPEFCRALIELFHSRAYTNRGRNVLQFESDLLAYFGNVELNLVTVANATLGLELALKAMGLKGKVVVSPFTFVATVNAIVNAGLEPVFADIDPDTLCLSPETTERLLTPDVAAVLPVHVYGTPCDTAYFEGLRAKGKKVIYDSAHAFAVKRNGVSLGAHGDAEVFSFHATKVMHSVEGGAVTSRDAELINRVRLLSNFGIANEFEIKLEGTNAKMSELHALVGIYCLKEIQNLVEARKRVAAYYNNALAEHSDLRIVRPPDDVQGNGQYFPIIFPTAELCEATYNAMRSRNINARRYFYPLVTQTQAFRRFAFQKTPVAESVSTRILCLPIHSYLEPRHQDEVLRVLIETMKVRSPRKKPSAK